MPDPTLFIVATRDAAYALRPFLKEGAAVIYVGQEVRLRHLGYHRRVVLSGRGSPLVAPWFEAGFSLDTDPDAG